MSWLFRSSSAASNEWTDKVVRRASVRLSMLDDQGNLQIKKQHACIVLFQLKSQDQDDNQLDKFECAVFDDKSSSDPNDSVHCLIYFCITAQLPNWLDDANHGLAISLQVNNKTCGFHLTFLNPKEETEFKYIWRLALYESASNQSFEQSMKTSRDKQWIEQSDQSNYNTENNSGNDILSMNDFPTVRILTGKNCKSSTKSNQSNELNGQMAIGPTNHAFITRSSQLSSLNLDQKANSVTSSRSIPFDPTELLLSQQDRHAYLLNPNVMHKVYDMDLETGSIVQELQVSDDFKVRHIASATKTNNQTNECPNMVMGVNYNSVFSLDNRISDSNKMAQHFTYSSGTPKMKCMTTGSLGQIATGSDTGEIRLFNSIDKRAKTLLPGLGNSIMGLDLSPLDGRYLLATCQTYLLLIDTHFQTDNSDKIQSGFNSSMANHASRPIKLQLSMNDLVKHNIRQLQLTKAFFSPDGRNIISSSDCYVIVWDVQKVLSKKPNCYTIRKCVDPIINNQFIDHNNRQNKVVVATSDKMIFTD